MRGRGGTTLSEKAFKSPKTLEYAAKWEYSFLIDAGKQEDAESWWEVAVKADEIHRLTQQERNNVTQKDNFKAPKISEELLGRVTLYGLWR